MKAKIDKIKCPVCNGRVDYCVVCKGVGEIKSPALKTRNNKYDKDGEMKKAAEKLRTKKYTLREIAEILGYNHPQSIANLLNKKPCSK